MSNKVVGGSRWHECWFVVWTRPLGTRPPPETHMVRNTDLDSDTDTDTDTDTDITGQYAELELDDNTLFVYDLENPSAWIQSSEYYDLS